MTDTLFRQRGNKTQYIVPTEGSTVTMNQNPEGDLTLILAPATNLNAITIAWISSPNDGQKVTILCTKTIGAISNSGGTLNRSAGSIISATCFSYIYDATNATWMMQFNSSSQASSVVSIAFTATVSGGGGNAVFYATDNGLVGGNVLFSSIQSIQPAFDVADPLKAFAKPVVSNSNKTITINCKISNQNLVTVLGVSVIGSTTLANAPDGTALTILVHGVLA